MSQAGKQNRISRPPRKRRRLTLLYAGLAATLLAGVLAWLAFPLWAPALVAHQLPTGWQLQRLETGRPGLSSLEIAVIELRGPVPGFTLSARAEELTLGYPGLRIRAAHVAIELALAAAAEQVVDAAEQSLAERLSIPRWVPPGGLPHIEIARFDWSITGTGTPQQGAVSNLGFGQDRGSSRLGLSLARIPFLVTPGTLHVVLGQDMIELALETGESPPRRILYLRQSDTGMPGGEADSAAVASLGLDLDLALLARDTLAPWVLLAGLDPLERLEGSVQLGVQLQGTERLHAVAATWRLEGVAFEAGEERLELAWDGSVGRAGNVYDLRQDSIRLQADLLPSRWQALRPLIAATGIRFDLEPGPAAVSLSSDEPWLVTLSPGESTAAALSGSGRLGWAQAHTRITVEAHSARWRRQAGSPPDLQAELMLAIEHPGLVGLPTEVGQLTLNHPAGEVAGSVRYGAGGLEIRQGRITRLVAERLELLNDGIALASENVSLSGTIDIGAAVSLEGSFAGAGLDLADRQGDARSPLLSATAYEGAIGLGGTEAGWLRAEASLSGVDLPSLELAMDRLDLSSDGLGLAGPEGPMRVITTGLQLPAEAGLGTGVDVDATVQLMGGRPDHGTGELLVGLSGTLPFSFMTDAASGDPVVNLAEARLDATALPSLLRALGVALPGALSFQAGELVLDGALRLQQGADGLSPSGPLDITAEGVALALGESRVNGLELSGRLEFDERLGGQGELGIGNAELAAGLNLDRLSAGLSMDGAERITIRRLSAGLLGGTISAEELALADGELGASTLHWTDFDLGALIAFLDVTGLDASGRLDATLPLVNEAGGMGVTAGSFQSRQGGRIRYSTGLPAANIGMQALENFQFESLSGQIDYRASGDYTIGVKLLGRNPDLYGGHPISFQLNLGGELPALFRSLFVTGDFEKAILEQLNSRQLDTPE